MIIVSQDKDLVVEMKNIMLSGDTKIAIAFDNTTCISVGEYQSRRRAKEVLTEIVDAYHHCLDVYYMPEE